MAPLHAATRKNLVTELLGACNAESDLLGASIFQDDKQNTPCSSGSDMSDVAKQHNRINAVTSSLNIGSRQVTHPLHARSSGGDEAAVVGVVLGVVFFVVVLLLVSYIYWWRASSTQRQSSSSRRRDEKRRREKKSKRRNKSEKRTRAYRREKYGRRHSPSSTSSHREWKKSVSPFIFEAPRFPTPVAQPDYSFWRDSGSFNEMDAPQMTYSDDGLGHFESKFGRQRLPFQCYPAVQQGHLYNGRRRRSQSWSSCS